MKRKGLSPTARTLAECRKRGWIAQVVEQTIRIPGKRTFKRDLFGVIDIVAVTPTGILGIQATSGSNVSSRINKAKAESRLIVWLRVGARFEVWGWAKQGPRGKRKTWQLRAEEIVIVGRGRNDVALPQALDSGETGRSAVESKGDVGDLP